MPTDVVKGWVAKTQTSRWNTRTAVKWDRLSTLAEAAPRRSSPGIGLDTLEGARKVVAGRPLEPGDIAFREEFAGDQTAVVRKPEDPKYALSVLDKMGEDARTGNELYRVGWVGNFVGEASDPKVDLNQLLDELDQRLRYVIDEARLLEVLVVVDDTEGMQEYFPEVGQALRTVFGGWVDTYLQEQGDLARTMRLAVAYYGDEQHSNFGPAVQDGVAPRSAKSTRSQRDHQRGPAPSKGWRR